MKELERVYAPIAAGLAQADALIAERINPRFRALVGGKRLRPALVLFAGHAFGGPDRAEAARIAAAIELVHAASLVHDDIIDSASRRRSGTALHRLIGTKPAVLFADLLFVSGLALIDAVRPALVHEVIAGVKEMCEGQWLEARLAHAREPGWEEYLEVVDKKTASLFACCCRAGGLLRRAPAAERDALEQFGRSFGQAFQLRDDARDAGRDLADPVDRALRKLGGPRLLRSHARVLAAQARAALGSLKNGIERRGLAGMLARVTEV